MSIINPISMGGDAWKAATNTSASTSAISFPVSHEPSDWMVLRITDLTSNSDNSICHICKTSDTYYDWYLYNTYFRRGSTPTGSYNSGTFTVTAGGSDKFTTTVGDYVLVYI